MIYQLFIRITRLIVLCCICYPAHGAGQQELRIHTASHGEVTFRVELAVSAEQRRRGLMHRDHLPQRAGMLFDYGSPKHVAMWMKDTRLPLDIIFINADGRIARIHEHAEPGSLEHIRSRGKVLAVLELNAGTVQAFGIARGDLVEHPIFHR